MEVAHVKNLASTAEGRNTLLNLVLGHSENKVIPLNLTKINVIGPKSSGKSTTLKELLLPDSSSGFQLVDDESDGYSENGNAAAGDANPSYVPNITVHRFRAVKLPVTPSDAGSSSKKAQAQVVWEQEPGPPGNANGHSQFREIDFTTEHALRSLSDLLANFGEGDKSNTGSTKAQKKKTGVAGGFNDTDTVYSDMDKDLYKKTSGGGAFGTIEPNNDGDIDTASIVVDELALGDDTMNTRRAPKKSNKANGNANGALNIKAKRDSSLEELFNNELANKSKMQVQAIYTQMRAKYEEWAKTAGDDDEKDVPRSLEQVPFFLNRGYTDEAFDRAKKDHRSLRFDFWEFSENYANDSLYCGIYKEFFTSKVLTIVFFDLKQMQSKPKQTLKNIALYLELALAANTKVMLVGTKLDLVEKKEDLDAISKQIEKTVKKLAFKNLILYKELNLLFFPVDNEKGFGHSSIRKMIIKASRTDKSISREMSLRDAAWLDLLFMEKVQKNGNPVATMSMKEVKFYAESMGVDMTEFENTFELFKATGAVIHMPHIPALGDIVIIDSGRFLSAIRNVMDVNMLNEAYKQVHQPEEKKMNNKFANNAFLKQAGKKEQKDEPTGLSGYARNYLITFEMVEKICSDVGIETDVVISFLKHTLALTEWNYTKAVGKNAFNLPKNGRSERLYFVPGLLNNQHVVRHFLKKQGLQDSQILEKKYEEESEFMGVQRKNMVTHFELIVQPSSPIVFPTAVFNAAIMFLINFFNQLKPAPGEAVSVRVLNKENLPVAEFKVGVNKLLLCRPSRDGVSLLIPAECKESTFAFMSLVHLVLDQVSRDMFILPKTKSKTNVFRFSWLVFMENRWQRVKALLKELNKTAKNGKISDVLSEYVKSPNDLIKPSLEDLQAYFSKQQ